MIENLFSKDNLALFGVTLLFLWRIIDFFIRQSKKRENDLEKLAFEMAKYRHSDDHGYPAQSFFSYYLFYLDHLEKRVKPYDENSYEVMRDYESIMTEKIKRMDEVSNKLGEIDKKFTETHEITFNDLFERNLTWGLWWRETTRLIKRSVKRKTKYHSLK
jgi:hypothetical protein